MSRLARMTKTFKEQTSHEQGLLDFFNFMKPKYLGCHSMQIKDLKIGMNGVTLQAKVIEKSAVWLHNGKEYASAIIEDDSGSIKLNLWRNQTKIIQIDDNIVLKDAFVHTRGKKIQVSTWSEIEKF